MQLAQHQVYRSRDHGQTHHRLRPSLTRHYSALANIITYMHYYAPLPYAMASEAKSQLSGERRGIRV